MKCLHTDENNNRCDNDRGYKTRHFGVGRCYLHDSGYIQPKNEVQEIIVSSFVKTSLSIYNEDESIDNELISEETPVQEIRLLRKHLKRIDDDIEFYDEGLKKWRNETGENVPKIEFSRGFLIAASNSIDKMISTNIKLNRQFLGKKEVREIFEKFSQILREVISEVLQDNLDDANLFYKIYDEIIRELGEVSREIRLGNTNIDRPTRKDDSNE